MVYTSRYPSPLGELQLAADERGLVGLWIHGQKYFGGTVTDGWQEKPDAPFLDAGRRWLDAYFAGQRPGPHGLPLAPRGGTFRQTVWKILQEIPYGTVTTYGAVAREAARRLGKARMSAQAAGGAVGHNPIAIIIPCHRVVGADGGLTGYAGGLDIKAWLLRHEGADIV